MIGLNIFTTQNPEPAPKKSLDCEEKAYLMLKKCLKLFKGNTQVLKKLTLLNQNKAKKFNIGRNKLVLEMDEDTLKYKVRRA